jgi:hypothetical protein
METKMNIAPLSMRVITDIYDIGFNTLDTSKKANICFFKTNTEYTNFVESEANFRQALTSTFQKLCRFVTSDNYPEMTESFSTEERLAWAFSTRVYVNSLKSVIELYENDLTLNKFDDNILSACNEALFIESQMAVINKST